MIIKGEKVTIRGIEQEDLEFLRDIINDPELEKFENGFNFPISTKAQALWYEKYLRSGEYNRFIIEDEEGNRIGYTCLLNLDWKNRKAHTGIKIPGIENRRKGYGEDAVKAIMNYAFYELQLNRLESFILSTNMPSIKLYTEKCGWQKEGLQRKAVYKNGEYDDLIMIGVLKEDLAKF